MTQPLRALILVDIQNEYFEGPMEIQYPPREQSLSTITDVIAAAEENNIPIAAIRHEFPEDAPVYAAGSKGAALHPEIAALVNPDWHQDTKAFASVFAGTDVEEWIREQNIDTVTLVGYMTNNCIIGSAVDAEPLGLTVEVLSDATGAISMSNDAGSVDAETLHNALLTVLHSNLASVTDSASWKSAVADGAALPVGNLVETAMQGRSHN